MQAEAGPDRRCQRHDRNRAQILQPLRHQRIVVAVNHDLKAVIREHLRRAQGLDHIGIKSFLFAQHFKFHEAPAAGLARKAQGADRIFPREAASGVGQIGDRLRIDEIDQLGLAGVRQVHAADGNGDEFRTAGSQRGRILRIGFVFAGTDNQP